MPDQITTTDQAPSLDDVQKAFSGGQAFYVPDQVQQQQKPQSQLQTTQPPPSTPQPQRTSASGIAVTPSALDQNRQGMDPQALYILSRPGARGERPLFEQEDAFILKDPNSAVGQWTDTYRGPEGYYDVNGRPLKPEMVVPRARTYSSGIGSSGSWRPIEIYDKDHPDQYPDGRRLVNFHSSTGEIQPIQGDPTPLPKNFVQYRTGADKGLIDYKQQFRNSTQYFTSANSLNRWFYAQKQAIDKMESEPDFTGQGRKYAPQDIAKMRQDLQTAYGEQKSSIDRHFVQPTIQQPKGAASFGGSADSLGNPFGITDPKTGKFTVYDEKNPALGLQAGLSLIHHYQSKYGVWKDKDHYVNQDSSLQDMMRQWAPKDDPRGHNDPDAYAASLAKDLNLPDGVNTKIGTINPTELAKAIMARELGGSGGSANKAAVAKAQQYRGIIDKLAQGVPPEELDPGMTSTAPPGAPPQQSGKPKGFNTRSFLGTLGQP